MKGWRDFLGGAERHLDGFPAVSGWLGKVTVPAFGANPYQALAEMHRIAEQAPPANPAMSILFHIGRQWRGVAELNR
jgi:hypothetical protein